MQYFPLITKHSNISKTFFELNWTLSHSAHEFPTVLPFSCVILFSLSLCVFNKFIWISNHVNDNRYVFYWRRFKDANSICWIFISVSYLISVMHINIWIVTSYLQLPRREKVSLTGFGISLTINMLTIYLKKPIINVSKVI